MYLYDLNILWKFIYLIYLWTILFGSIYINNLFQMKH